jgi:hypothetical protein
MFSIGCVGYIMPGFFSRQQNMVGSKTDTEKITDKGKPDQMTTQFVVWLDLAGQPN